MDTGGGMDMGGAGRVLLFVSLSKAGGFGEGVESRGEGFKGYVRL